METKKWYASKGIWAGIITIVLGGAEGIAQLFGFSLVSNPIYSLVVSVLGALGLYARATATSVVK
jgi:uncharacterized membrane protein